ncbi:MAG: N-acetyltransferase family protein [Acidobacteriota bacterium]
MAFEIREASESDRPEVAALVREMIPGADADARFAWLYEGNPAGRALTWIASEGGDTAGCTSYFPFRLQLDHAPVMCALGGDGYVRPKFRRRGLGGLLHDAARRAMPEHDIGCMYGAPGAMNLTPLKHGGSREVGHVARWARPLGSGLVREVLKPRFVPELDPMARHDPRVDEVWRAAAPSLRLACIRDSIFYTWRFLDAPAGREPAYVLVHRGRPVGACALEPMNGGKSLRIVDVIAVPGAWHACLAAIARHATMTDARIVDIKLMALDGRRRHLWRAGYLERDHKPFLVVIPKDGDRRFLDPTRWFYGGADSDLDFLD